MVPEGRGQSEAEREKRPEESRLYDCKVRSFHGEKSLEQTPCPVFDFEFFLSVLWLPSVPSGFQ